MGDCNRPPSCDNRFFNNLEIYNLIDNGCILPGDLPYLPDDLQDSVITSFWKKVDSGDSLSSRFLGDLAENGVRFLDREFYDILRAVSFNKNPITAGLASFALTRQIVDEVDFTPDRSVPYHLKRGWELLKDSKDSIIRDIAIVSGVEYLEGLLRNGEKDDIFVDEIDKIDIGNISQTTRSKYYLAMALRAIEHDDVETFYNQLALAGTTSTDNRVSILYYMQRLYDGSDDILKQFNQLRQNLVVLKKMLGNPKSDPVEFEIISSDIDAILCSVVHFSFRDRPFDAKFFDMLDGYLKEAEFAIDESVIKEVVIEWRDYLKNEDFNSAESALSLAFRDFNIGGAKFSQKIKRDIFAKLVQEANRHERQQWNISTFVSNFLKSDSVVEMFSAEAVRRLAFRSMVTSDNVEKTYKMFDSARNRLETLDVKSIPDDLRGRYHLIAGSASSQLAEFLIDHGAKLVSKRVIVSRDETAKMINKGIDTAREHFRIARELLPNEPETHKKYAWNEYYLAKYRDVFETSIFECRLAKDKIYQLMNDGFARYDQYFSAVRCFAWGILEEANTQALVRPDAVRTSVKEAIFVIESVDMKRLSDTKDKIDLGWLRFKANYVIGKTYPHPGRPIELGQDEIEPLSDEAGEYFDKADRALGDTGIFGETDGEMYRMFGWLKFRQGDSLAALECFNKAISLGVKYQDDTLRGKYLCFIERYVLNPNLPVEEKVQLLENAFDALFERIRLTKDPSLLNALDVTCEMMAKTGRKSFMLASLIGEIKDYFPDYPDKSISAVRRMCVTDK